MTTTTELITWLKTPSHIRTVLVEVEGVQTAPSTTQTFYLSSRPYISENNQFYIPCVSSGIKFNESLNIEGSFSTSINYGDIEVDNMLGDKDEWLNYIWVNKPVSIYIGDPRWSHTDYYLIFTGIVSDLVSKNKNTLNLILIDKSQKLNNAISETYFTNNILNGDKQLKPQTFGECFNVTPVLTNRIPNILEYCVHTGTIESIIEVRDNGLPVDFYTQGETITIDQVDYIVDQGCFALKQAPYGQITCSVQGHKNTTYYNTAPSLIKEILLNQAPDNIKLELTDFNLTNFSNIETQKPYEVGYYATDSTNTWDLCNKLANSIGCQLYFDTTGKLNLVRLDLVGNGNIPIDIIQDDYELNTLQISYKTVVQGTTNIAYCKNWTVQDQGLAAGCPPLNVNLFKGEWLYSKVTNATINTDYNLVDSTDQIDTYLITQIGADDLADKYNSLLSTKHYVYTFTGYPHLLTLNIGDNVTLTGNRFGLNNSPGIVVSVSRDWILGRVVIGVLV